MCDRIFSRKSRQTVALNKPQLALLNKPKSETVPSADDADDADDAVLALTLRRGKRDPVSATLTRIEIFHKLPEHELTCGCGCGCGCGFRKHVINDEISELLDIEVM